MDERTKDIVECALHGKLYGKSYPLYGKRLESDGRKRSKVLCALLDDGVIVKWDNKDEVGEYEPGPQALASVFSKSFSPVAVYAEMRAKGWKHWFIRAEDLTPDQTLGLLEGQVEGVRWYVVDLAPTQYRMSRYAEESGKQDMDNHSACPWYGPFDSLEKAREIHTQAYADHPKYRFNFRIVFDTAEVEDYIEVTDFEDLLEDHYPKHFAWGLVQCGILTEEEAYEEDQQGKKRPKVAVADGTGLIAGNRSSVSTKPEQWGDDVTDWIDRIIDQINKANEKLALLRKIELGVVAYGGWDQFLADYRQKLIEELKKGE